MRLARSKSNVIGVIIWDFLPYAIRFKSRSADLGHNNCVCCYKDNIIVKQDLYSDLFQFDFSVTTKTVSQVI
jgi:hypothetical protein